MTEPGAVVRSIADIPRLSVIGVLKTYRVLVSPLYGQVCRYFPSCSAYALESVTRHGALKGSYLATRRLIHCHPWSEGGLDPVPAGGRSWPTGHVPRIIMLNHPHDYLNLDGQHGESHKTTQDSRSAA